MSTCEYSFYSWQVLNSKERQTKKEKEEGMVPVSWQWLWLYWAAISCWDAPRILMNKPRCVQHVVHGSRGAALRNECVCVCVCVDIPLAPCTFSSTLKTIGFRCAC